MAAAALRRALPAIGLLAIRTAAFVPGGVLHPPHVRVPPAASPAPAASRAGRGPASGARASPLRATRGPGSSESASADALRSCTLTDVDGNAVSLGERMGNGTAVLVFLRHLGSVPTWDYAKSWCDFRERVDLSGLVEGEDVVFPLFISIGDREKLRIFLDSNPHVPRDQLFVDSDSYDAYNAAGLERLDKVNSTLALEALRAIKPLGYQPNANEIWEFARNFPRLAPIPWPDRVEKAAEGLLRLGGTVVVYKGKILYQWNDQFLGDHPEIKDVWRVVEEWNTVQVVR